MDWLFEAAGLPFTVQAATQHVFQREAGTPLQTSTVSDTTYQQKDVWGRSPGSLFQPFYGVTVRCSQIVYDFYGPLTFTGPRYL